MTAGQPVVFRSPAARAGAWAWLAFAALNLTVRFTGPGGTEQTLRAWSLQTSPRARAREERRLRKRARELPADVAAHLAGRTFLDHAVEQLTDLSARAARPARKEPGTVTWSLPPSRPCSCPPPF